MERIYEITPLDMLSETVIKGGMMLELALNSI